MNQPYARVNATTLRSREHKVFGVQLYKNNARALLSHILSIANPYWLQHARSVRRVYELAFLPLKIDNICVFAMAFKARTRTSLTPSK